MISETKEYILNKLLEKTKEYIDQEYDSRCTFTANYLKIEIDLIKESLDLYDKHVNKWECVWDTVGCNTKIKIQQCDKCKEK